MRTSPSTPCRPAAMPLRSSRRVSRSVPVDGSTRRQWTSPPRRGTPSDAAQQMRRNFTRAAAIAAALVVAVISVIVLRHGETCQQPKPVITFAPPAERLCGSAAGKADELLGVAGEKYLVGRVVIGERPVDVVAAAHADGALMLATIDGPPGSREAFRPTKGHAVRRVRDAATGLTLVYGIAPIRAARVVVGRSDAVVPALSTPAHMLTGQHPAVFALVVPERLAALPVVFLNAAGAGLGEDPPLTSR